MKKFAQVIIGALGLGAVVFGLLLLLPIVWAQVIAMKNAMVASAVANANALATFTNENPATVGIIALVVGAVLIIIAVGMSRDSWRTEKRERQTRRQMDEAPSA